MTRTQSNKLAETQGPLATIDIIQMVKMAQLTTHNCKIRDLIAPVIKEVKITLYKTCFRFHYVGPDSSYL